MKKLISYLILGCALPAFGQQLSLNSQYMFNELLVNPAVVGTTVHIPVQINYRKQWTNFEGAPTTQIASCHSRIFKTMGFGGYFFNDNAGPSRRTGLNINAAYHLRLDTKNQHILGVGMGLSLAQHLIDVTQLHTYLPNDPAVLRGFNNQFVPDANVGVYYRFKDRGFAGLSGYNLVQSKLDLFSVDKNIYNPLKRTYYFIGGYNFKAGKRFDIKPVTLIQAIETGTFQYDFSLIGTFDKKYWLGGTYRHGDAVSILAGATLGQFKFGYSYDYTLSHIGKYSQGSHEVFVELQLYAKESDRPRKGGRKHIFIFKKKRSR